MRLLAAVGPPAATVAALWPVLWSNGKHLGDHFTFWYAGHLLATGRSPYDAAAWAAAAAYGSDPGGVAVNAVGRQAELGVPVWLYPPYAGYVFVPFGLLPVDLGTGALHAALLAAGLAGLAALAALPRWRSGLAAGLAAAALIASYPFVVTVRGGALDGLLLLGLALVAWGLRARSAWPLVLGAVVLALKPHLVLGVALGVGIVLARRRDGRALGLLVLALAAIAGSSVAADPGAVPALARGGGESFRALPQYASLWAFGEGAAGSPLVGAALVAVTVALALAAARPHSGGDRWLIAAAAACIAGVALPPYLGSYDQLLALAPAALVAAAVADRLAGRAALAAVLVATVALPWLVYALATGVGAWVNGPVILGCAVLLAWAARAARAAAAPG